MVEYFVRVLTDLGKANTLRLKDNKNLPNSQPHSQITEKLSSNQ